MRVSDNRGRQSSDAVVIVCILLAWCSCCRGEGVRCSLQLQGQSTGLRDARISCSGPGVTLGGDPELLQPFQHQFEGVQLDPEACRASPARRCLLSFCGDAAVVLADSSVLGVQLRSLDAIICFSGSSSVAWRGANITGNLAGRHGAVLLTGAARVLFQDSVIANNTAVNATVASGGGVAVLGDASLTLISSKMISNAAISAELAVGGAIFCNESARLDIQDSLMSGNAALRSQSAAMSGGGAVCAHGSGSINVSGSVFVDNTASGAEPGRESAAKGSWELFLISIDMSSLFNFNTASNGLAAGGGAILVFGSRLLRVSNSSFSGNVAAGSAHGLGGAMAVLEDAVAVVQHSSIVGNQAGHSGQSGFALGGGIAGSNSSQIRVYDTLIRDNLAMGYNVYAGGVYAGVASNVTLVRCNVTNNTADNTIVTEFPGDAPGWGRAAGGAIALSDFAALQMDGCVIAGNRVMANLLGNAGGGGIVAVVAARIHARSTLFQDNVLHGGNEGGGGGLGCAHSVVAVVENCTFIRNLATCQGGCTGGGVHAHDSSTVNISSSVFVDNVAQPLGAAGGPVREGMGGGVGAECNGTVIITTSSFRGNSAAGYQGVGGGVFIGGTSTGRITNCSFSDNHASLGAGIGCQGPSNVNISDCLVTHHSTAGSGAGVMLSGRTEVNIKDTIITHNRASEGGGVYAHSPGEAYTLRLINSSITHNNAMSGGGCLFRGGDVHIGPGCSISNNIAHQQGGGFAWLSGCWGGGDCPSAVDVSCEATIESNAAAVAGGGAFIGDSSLESSFSLSDMCMQHVVRNNSAAFGDVNVFYVRHDCRVGEVSRGGWCDVCPTNMFSFDAGSGAFCHICPNNCHCPGGDKLYPENGYWHSHNFSTQVHKCPNEEACVPTSAGSAGRGNGSMDWQCAPGYTGILCASCVEGWGPRSPFDCAECMPPMQTALVFLVALLCIVLLLSVVSQSIWSDNQSQFFSELHVSDVLKLLLLYTQYLWVMGSTPMDWPRPISAVFWGVAWVFATCTNRAISLDCLLSSSTDAMPQAIQRVLVYLLNPVLVFLAVTAVLCLFWCVHVLRRRLCLCSRTQVSFAAYILPRMPVVLLVVVFFFYPSLVRASLSMFACFKVDVAGQQPYPQYAVADASLGYYVSDMQQPCWQGWHKTYALALGIPLVALFCAGFPAAVLWLLVLYNNGALCVEGFQQRFGFLYRTFRPERYYWEAALAVQTVLLVCISVFAHIVGPYYELIMFAVVFTAGLVVHLWLQPFAFVQLHRLQLGSMACLALTAFAGLTFLGDGSSAHDPSVKRYQEVFGVLILVPNVVFLLCCLGLIAKVAFKGGLLRRSLQSRKRSYRDAEVHIAAVSTSKASVGKHVSSLALAADATAGGACVAATDS